MKFLMTIQSQTKASTKNRSRKRPQNFSLQIASKIAGGCDRKPRTSCSPQQQQTRGESELKENMK